MLNIRTTLSPPFYQGSFLQHDSEKHSIQPLFGPVQPDKDELSQECTYGGEHSSDVGVSSQGIDGLDFAHNFKACKRDGIVNLNARGLLPKMDTLRIWAQTLILL